MADRADAVRGAGATDGARLTVTCSMLSLLRQSSREMAYTFVAHEVAYGDGTSEAFQAK